MKHHAGILILSILSFVSATCQIKLVNQSLKDTTQNVLFLNFYNRVTIKSAAKGVFALVTSKASSVHKISTNVFTVSPHDTGKITLFVYEGSEQVFQQHFDVQKALDVLSFGSIKNGATASKAEIIASRKFLFYIPGCNCSPGFFVRNFTINFVSNNLDESKKVYHNWATMLTEEAISIIKNLKSGDKIVFTDIYLQDIDSYPGKAADFMIFIK